MDKAAEGGLQGVEKGVTKVVVTSDMLRAGVQALSIHLDDGHLPISLAKQAVADAVRAVLQAHGQYDLKCPKGIY